MPAPSLVVQTTYAELLERCTSAAFSASFSSDGAFTSKTINGRRYWYFQLPSSEGRDQKYVGPETQDLLDQIARHKEIRDDEKERRALVSTLVRSFGLARPIPEIGNIIAALSKAGVFRLRGVLVGTVAYQTYSGMLGTKLPMPALQTGDVDIAQFKSASVGVADSTPPVLDVLKEVDVTFCAIPPLQRGGNVTSYQAKGGLRVDFLTSNEGPDTDAPQPLPALQTDAPPLRFLDYLIHDAEPAIVLHGAGIYTLVPAPERYALHKLIISRRRRESATKQDKDVQQAEALLDVLAKKRPHEIKMVWDEAVKRGAKWRQLLLEGMAHLSSRTRDITLQIVGERRSIVPGITLTFRNPAPRDDASRGVVIFSGEALGERVQCEISREALADHFGANGSSKQVRLDAFHQNRSTIENLARTKFLSWNIDQPEIVLIDSTDIPLLLKEMR